MLQIPLAFSRNFPLKYAIIRQVAPLAQGERCATKDILWLHKYGPQSQRLVGRAEAGEELDEFANRMRVTWEVRNLGSVPSSFEIKHDHNLSG